MLSFLPRGVDGWRIAPSLSLLLLFLAPVQPVGFARNEEPRSRSESARAPRYTIDQILDAIRRVETGGCKDGGRDATGDDGRAIGPYQVHHAHWLDSRVPGRFEDCRDLAYARLVVVAYWKRWCPVALERAEVEVLARVHNGGPKGAEKACTLPFGTKVLNELQQAQESAEIEGGRAAARTLPHVRVGAQASGRKVQ